MAAFLALWWNAPQGDWVAIWRTATCGMWCASPSGRRFSRRALCRARDIPCPRPLPQALSRRLALLRLCAMTLILPVLVAFSAFLASMVARAGWHRSANRRSGVDLFALRPARHFAGPCVFNLPMASRLLLQALENIPGNNVNLPPSLGCVAGTSFVSSMAVVTATNPASCCAYLYALFASFATVLSLGGGPQATTIEWLFIRR